MTGLEPGDHLAHICDHPSHWPGLVVPLVREGLARGELCLCLCGNQPAASLAALLRRAESSRANHVAGARARLAPTGEFFLHNGYFDPRRALARVEEMCLRGIRDGRQGLRLIADMSWAADSRLFHEALLEYEELVNLRLSRRLPLTMICHFQSALFPPPLLEDLARSHHKVVEMASGAAGKPARLIAGGAGGEGHPALMPPLNGW